MARKPICLLAGGPGSRRRGPDPLVARALSLADTLSPNVAYVGAPSGDNRAFFVMIAGILRRAGAGEVEMVRLCGREPDLGRAREQLAAADLVFITGGDVEEGMGILDRTGIASHLVNLADRGKPFLGVSAGSIMLARGWIRWQDPDDASSAAIFPCLGLAPVYCDTHGEADGWEELTALLALAADGERGHGIATGTGLLAFPGGVLEAIGGPVHRYERRDGATVRIADLAPLQVSSS